MAELGRPARRKDLPHRPALTVGCRAPGQQVRGLVSTTRRPGCGRWVTDCYVASALLMPLLTRRMTPLAPGRPPAPE